MTLFGKIIRGELPTTKVYEDDTYLAFKDINPLMKTHVLIVPKKEGISSFVETAEEDRELVKGMMDVAWKIIDEHGLTGCRLQYNSGESHGQEVFHIHLHLMSHDPLKEG